MFISRFVFSRFPAILHAIEKSWGLAWHETNKFEGVIHSEGVVVVFVVLWRGLLLYLLFFESLRLHNSACAHILISLTLSKHLSKLLRFLDICLKKHSCKPRNRLPFESSTL